MIKNENKNVLKGQQTLAQGKRRRSVALGWRTFRRIVRAILVIEEKFLFRTKEMILIFQEMMLFYSFRKKIFALNIIFSRTVFVALPLPRAMPWAKISWPFMPGKYNF